MTAERETELRRILTGAFDALSGLTDRFPNFPVQPLDPVVVRNIGNGLLALADAIEEE